MALTKADRGCALSEVFLQAVAEYAGYPCQVSNRLLDNSGIDASLHVNKDFGPTALRDFDAKIQLKHCTNPTTLQTGDISHDLEVATYNKFRETRTGNFYLLVLLVLDPNPDKWLTCTPKQLCIKGVAYYASIYGRPAPTGDQTAAVHYAKRKRFTVESLETVLRTFATGGVSNI